MAVRKQRRQAFSQRIGVVRANTGAGLVTQSINNLADNLIESSFESLKVEAQKAGQEFAQSKSLESIRTINPATGKPEAYQAPEGYGTIAQDAYNRVIQQRFINTVEQDFKTKAAELAIEYQDDPDAVTKYSDAFDSFVGGYLQNVGDAGVDPSIQNIVDSMGSQLLASNKLNLMQRQAQTRRTNTRNDFAVTFESANADLQFLHASPERAEDAALLENKQLQHIEDMFEGGFITQVEAQGFRRDLVIAKAVGLTNRLEQSALTSDSNVPTSVLLNRAETVLRGFGKGMDSLPESMQGAVNEILELELDGSSALSQVLPEVEKYFNDATANARANEAYQKQTKSDQERADAEEESLRAAEVKANRNVERDAVNSAITDAIRNGDFLTVNFQLDAYEAKLKADKVSPSQQDTLLNPLRKKAIHAVLAEFMVPKKGDEPYTSDELQAAQMFLVDGRKMEGLSDRVLSVLEKTDPYKNASTESTIQNAVSSAFSNALNREQKIREAEERTRNAARVSSGLGDATSKRDREIQNGNVFGNIEQEPIVYVRTADSLQNADMRKVIIGSSVLPQALVDYGNQFLSMQLTEEQQITFLQHYANYAAVLNPHERTGKFRNMWSEAGFTAKDIGFFDAILDVAAVHPDGISAVPEIRGTLLQTVQDPKAFQAAKENIFGDQKVTDFVDEITTTDPWFGFSVPNPQVTQELMPYVEYYIASGVPKEKIRERLMDTMKTFYKETDGVVVDLPFGSVSKSMHSLRQILPSDNERDMAIDYMNQKILEAGDEGKYFRRLPAQASIDERAANLSPAQRRQARLAPVEEVEYDPERLYLQPFPMAGTSVNVIRYMVMRQAKSGAFEPYVSPNGELMEFTSRELVLHVADNMLPEGAATQADIEKREQQRIRGTVFSEEDVMRAAQP